MNTDYVEVILALANECHRRQVVLADAPTVGEAVVASGLDRLCETLTGAAPSGYGVYGRRLAADEPVTVGQRIEVLRALEIDPKAARRERVNKTRAARRAGRDQMPD